MRVIVPGLQPNTQYALQIRSNDGEAVSDWSRVIEVLTIGDSSIPKAPANFAWAVSGTSFLATWDDVTQNTDNSPFVDFDHYDIVLTNGATNVSYKTQAPRFDFSLEMNSAAFSTPKATVQAKVRAVDRFGNPGAFTSTLSATNPPPNPPTSLSITPATQALNLKWTAPADLDLKSFNIYASTTSGFTPGPGNLVGNVAGTNFTYGTSTIAAWYFVVKSVDVFGTESTTGASGSGTPNSPFVTDAIAPKTPTGLAATIATAADLSTSALVSWSAVTQNSDNSPITDLAGYTVRYRRNGTTNWSEQDVPPDQTSVTVTGLTPYVSYDFSISAYDFSSNRSAWSSVITQAGATNSAPSQPAAPTVASNTMQIQVTITGNKAAGGAMEPDVDYYEVYASTTTGFTPSSSNLLGLIDAGPAMVGTFLVPTSGSGTTQTYFVKIIAVDNATPALKSTASPQATATPGLISGANIVDATITSAKIQSLAVDKLVAGAGIIADLTVKSTLTLGDASTNGTIQSYEYVNTGGVSGYQITKNSFVVKSGAIEAAALRIQSGVNLMPAAFADFEFTPVFYTNPASFFTQNAVGTAITTSPIQFNRQKMSLVWSALSGANQATAWMGGSTTDFNIPFEAGGVYIVSAYVRTSVAGTNARLRVKWSDGTIATAATATATGTFTRISGIVTVPAGIATGIMFIDSTTQTAASLEADGLQVEQRLAALSTPSTWKPPSFTTIDGGGIRTGSIRSTEMAIDDSGQYITGEPAWSIDMSGGAQLGDVLVRGSIIVGVEGENQFSRMQSFNYSPAAQSGGSGAGWLVRSDGFSEFTNVRATFTVIGQSSGRMELNNEGFFTYDTAGNPRIELPLSTGSTNVWRGDGQMDNLDVQGDLSVSGRVTVLQNGSITLAKGVSNPLARGSYDPGYQNVKYVDDGKWGDRHGWAFEANTGNYYTLRSTQVRGGFLPAWDIVLEAWNPTTGVMDSSQSLFDSVASTTGVGLALNASGIVVILQGASAYTWRLYQWATGPGSSVNFVGTYLFPDQQSDIGSVTIGPDSTNSGFAVAQRNNSGFLRMRRYTVNFTTATVTQGTVVTGNTAWNAAVAGVHYGVADGGTVQWWVTNYSGGDIRAYNTSGTEVTADSFLSASDNKIGFAYNGSRFVTTTQGGRMHYYEGGGNKWTGATTRIFYGSYAWSDGPGGHVTTRAPYSTFTMYKRARLTMSSPSIPTGLGVTSAIFYVSSTNPGSTPGNMFAQGVAPYYVTPVTGNVAQLFVSSIQLSGTVDLAATTFTSTGLSYLKTAGEEYILDSNGQITGSWTNWTTFTPAGAPTVFSETLGYRKDPQGLVWLRGRVVLPTNGTSYTIFTFPTGFRPTRDVATKIIYQHLNGTARVTVDAAGDLSIMGISGGTFASLDGISFPTS